MPYRGANVEYENDICNKCAIKINKTQASMICDTCGKVFHLRCKGIIGANIKLAQLHPSWSCSKDCTPIGCNSSFDSPGVQRSLPFGNEESTNESPLAQSSSSSSESIMEVCIKLDALTKAFYKLESVIKDVRASQQFLSDSFDDIQKKIPAIIAENVYLKNKIVMIEDASNSNKIKISNLEAELDFINHREQEKNVLLAGVPNEANIDTLISNIFKHLNCGISVNDVLSAKRFINKKNTSDHTHSNPPLICISFKSILSKKCFVDEMKKVRPVFANQLELNVSNDRIIYVRDHLSKFQLKIFKELKYLQKEHNIIQFTWTKNMNIFVKYAGDHQPFRVVSLEDLEKVKIRHDQHSVSNQSNIANLHSNTILDNSQFQTQSNTSSQRTINTLDYSQ